MFPRSLNAILQAPESQRFDLIGEGLEKLASSVLALEADAGSLAESRRFQSAAVLRCFADEEAAKILILLDVARVGWKQQAEVSKLMKWFYQHLARGLYVQAYHGNPADLAEVRRYVDGSRTNYYLDGPMDVDWIFRNEVLSGREERLYVDYIREEDGTCHWIGPAERAAMVDEPYTSPIPMSFAVRLVKAMHGIGLLTSRGLQAIHRVWDGVTVDDAMHWSDLRPLNIAVIDGLKAANTEDNRRDAAVVCERWIFPLHTLDLSEDKVTVADLQRIREQRLAWESGVGTCG